MLAFLIERGKTIRVAAVLLVMLALLGLGAAGLWRPPRGYAFGAGHVVIKPISRITHGQPDHDFLIRENIDPFLELSRYLDPHDKTGYDRQWRRARLVK